jgi:alanyl-tRNA synthetase
VDSVAEIANKVNDSGSIAVIVGKNVQAKGIKAGNLVKDLAAVCSGRGGLPLAEQTRLIEPLTRLATKVRRPLTQVKPSQSRLPLARE